MEYNLSITGTSADLTISGKITFADHASFQSILKELNQSSCKNLGIHVSNVEYLDSAGIGMFLLVHRQFGDGAVSIHGAKGTVKKVLELSNFDRMFKIID